MEATGKMLMVTSFMFGYFYISDAQTNSPLRVSAVLDSPYLMLDWRSEKEKYIGFLPDLLDKLNLTYTITLSPDSQYGVQHENRSWGGMVGELVNGNADLAGLLSMVSPRSDVIDFSYPVMPVGMSILISRPSVYSSPAITRLLVPFDFSVWLVAIVLFFVVGTVLYLIERFNPYGWRRMARDHEATVREGESFSCLNSFFFIASTLMWQGYNQAPRSIGARVLVAAWWIFTVILIVAYTGSFTNLCSTGFFAADNERELPVQSFRDIAHSNMRVGFLQGGATNKFFQESKSPVYQKIYEKVTNDPNFGEYKTTRSLLREVRTRRHGYEFVAILENPTAKYIANRKPCDLLHLDEDLPHTYYAFGLQKGSPHATNLNSALVRLTETGEIHELEREWFVLKGECPNMSPVTRRKRPTFNQLNLSTFYLAILIVCLGIVLGVIICVVEICVYKRTKSQAKDEETKPMTVNETCVKSDETQEGATSDA